MHPDVVPRPVPDRTFLAALDARGRLRRTPTGLPVAEARLATFRGADGRVNPRLELALVQLDDACLHEGLPRPRIVRVGASVGAAEAVARRGRWDAWVRAGRPMPGNSHYLAPRMSMEWAWPVNACPFQAGIGVQFDVEAIPTAALASWSALARSCHLHPYAALPVDHPLAGVYLYRPATLETATDIGDLCRRLIYVSGLFHKTPGDDDKTWGMAAGYLAFGGYLQGSIRAAFTSELADAAEAAGLARPRPRAGSAVLGELAKREIGFDALRFFDRMGV